MPQGREPVWPAGSRVYSILPLTNHHQCGSNQLWCWRKMKLKEKIPRTRLTPTPGTRRPYVIFPPLLPTSPQVSGADCSFGEMNKLTWLFWAKGQRQTCQWSRPLARHKTPQYPSQTLFSFCFPSLPQSSDLNTFYWYQRRHKHCNFLCRLCYKSVW